MKRVMVIGCCGAGKSTFSRELHSITSLELIHLDSYYWKSNWTETKKEEWKETVSELSLRDSWIIDGNYGGTMDIRIARADTIIYLDFPTMACLWRITKRTFKYYNKTRPDMPEGCPERIDLDFYMYVATFNWKRRKSLLKKLNDLPGNKQLVVLRNNTEITNYLNLLNTKK